MATQSEHNQSREDDLGDLRDSAIKVATRLTSAGFIAYFAGGCVRDRLMGHKPTDYDVATDAKPQDVANIFPRVQTVGESFGVMLVRMRGHVIQVATFRTEGVYSDGRHPDSVQFSDAEHDASRRDFTINGLFEDPLTGKVIDYVGGLADLDARVIRAIGDPHARLREDRLRMLRAVRFAARFGFSIHPDTADAIRTGASHLEGVSRERVGQEVKRMLCDANRAVAAWELQSLGLDEQVLQESSMRVALTRLSHLPDDASFTVALTAWLLDRHARRSAEELRTIASRWADALMLSNDERSAVVRGLGVYLVLISDWAQLGVAAQKRLAAGPEFDSGMMLLQASDRDQFVQARRQLLDLTKSGIAPQPLIDGADLIQQGLRPGPIFSRVLEAVYDAQLEGSVQTKPQAIEMAAAVARSFGNS